ncbi:GlxA family transcriptional regulator [Burkholderia ubonensis]|uniref:AraC family transcriptional regulator n=1 Tax=Burkholderia ubonensis TaxID=101571 RepID=A0ABD4DVS6_9BURK|nr:GlxA family transcriptional regulator [Burkholderia ubonensis]KVG34697.1 AraC family transcriptional regulator [Burkholderia ubonensis]KVN76166.1 AraC family transcriptional regulator [Burkholderia ubonensis]KVQ97481.1 AraC family transcriptional regulator [Burkholderia ubonensis]KVU00900.1 AraC family transcriptional regulator [Burkholderia ubonensis]KVZ63058.1 AraC family transcriptional regulator [Burkholderia ubonensis]
MPHRIAVLVFPDFQLLDAAGPVAAFEVASYYRDGHYTMRTIAAQAGLVRSSSGVSWAAEGLPPASAVDTLLIAGGDGVDALIADARLHRFVQRCAKRGARVTSVCTGSLLLAAAGVLDNRRATTHWSRSDQFARAFPQVHLEPDHIYVNDGPFWTSAGISAGIDLALALIGEDLGERVARAVARQLVVYYRRPGGQSQFSALIEMDCARGRFKPLLDHVRRNLGARHRVSDMAERACMSPRHFARAFQEETGLTPAKAVEKLRVEAARAALESGASSLQRVANECGFGDAENMRRSFLRLLGVPPSLLRAR